MHPPQVSRLARLVLNVGDLAQAVRFYEAAIGFTVVDHAEGGARLRLGGQEIELKAAFDGAQAYPTPRAANDPWFQHFAIAVSDMAEAYARVSRHGAEPISQGGPQLLPPSTGSVTAYKFRDPDGHPLELSYDPHRPIRDGGPVFLGIDHTALAVSDLDASQAFYEGLGLRRSERLLNQGPEQDRLDGLQPSVVDIVVMHTPEPGPHLELLHYRSPAAPAALRIQRGDVAATVTVFGGSEPGAQLRDPDGHFVSTEP